MLATRIAAEAASAVLRRYPDATHHELGRCVTWSDGPVAVTGRGKVLVVTAGTSDLPVAEETVVSARHLGNEVELLSDVGVAGIHRVLEARSRFQEAAVVIVIAYDQFKKMSASEQKLSEFFGSSPLAGEDLDLTRDKSAIREGLTL